MVDVAGIIAGLLVLYFALDMGAGAPGARMGAVSAGVALGLYGVLQAVDGVALKQVVDAWVSAPGAEEEAARFAHLRLEGKDSQTPVGTDFPVLRRQSSCPSRLHFQSPWPSQTFPCSLCSR